MTILKFDLFRNDNFCFQSLQISMSHEVVSGNCQEDRENSCKSHDESSGAWAATPSRRSVHEMIKRFQQVPGMHNGWRGARSVSSEPTTSPDHSQCSQGQRVQPQGIATNGWHPEGQGENFIRSSSGLGSERKLISVSPSRFNRFFAGIVQVTRARAARGKTTPSSRRSNRLTEEYRSIIRE